MQGPARGVKGVVTCTMRGGPNLDARRRQGWAKPNWANRTIFTGDNLDVMRGMNSESVDLIYLDPPFNSNRNYSAPVGSEAAGAAFKDAWTMSDVKAAEHGEVADRNPALYKVIDAAGETHGKPMMAYLIMMSVRLLEMRRLIKQTGSIYLHCDPTASHYLKLVLDAIFGEESFQNEIVWYYRGAGVPKRARARRHDNLLLYARNSADCYFDPDPIRQEYAEATKNRFKHYIGNVRDGRDYGTQSLNPKGKHPDDVITHIQPVAPSSRARLGYPTQKPLELLLDIIASSSKQGDVVLDPFCGCATACVAAEDLKRQWVGIDLSSKAAELVIQRFSGTKQLTLLANRIIHRTDIPQRTDLGRLPNYRTHKHTLFGEQEGLCAGCCHPFPFRNFTIDHIVAQSRGGTDHLDNLQLLCNACNSMKGTRSQAEFRAELKRIGITGS